jgi:hypothetical protein
MHYYSFSSFRFNLQLFCILGVFQTVLHAIFKITLYETVIIIFIHIGALKYGKNFFDFNGWTSKIFPPKKDFSSVPTPAINNDRSLRCDSYLMPSEGRQSDARAESKTFITLRYIYIYNQLQTFNAFI